MVLPFVSPTSDPRLSEEERIKLVLEDEIRNLMADLGDMNNYRDYYEGEQSLVYGTEKFQSLYGDAFADYKDNWCSVVVDAVADKLEVQNLILPDNENLQQAIWDVFRRNDIDEQQMDLHEGVLVEGRAAMVVWPDDELGVRLDWNPGQLVQVRYSEEDWRKPVWAMKRWVTPDGEVRVNLYTPRFVYKYRQGTEPTGGGNQRGVWGTVPDTPPGSNLTRREIDGEPWPLPNPLGTVPVVEFRNKRGSEIKDVIPQQDAVNFLMVAALGASAFTSLPQRVFLTGANEPDGGWDNAPGRVWKLPPMFDSDGRPHFGQMGEFRAADLSGFRTLVEQQLQHMAHTSKTPVRLFFQSDRGGRGDAPSGESLLVDDEPLLDKVEDRQKRFGNSWFRVVRLVNRALQVSGGTRGAFDDIAPGEMIWKDPRAKYRASLLEEGTKMFAMGIPIEFIVKKLGFSPDEIDMVMDYVEMERERKAQEQEEQFRRQQQEIGFSRFSNTGNSSSD